MTNPELNLKIILDLIPNKMHIKIHGCFRLTVLPDWKREPQNNNDQHILFVKSGNGKYFFKDDEEILEKGKLIYVSSSCPHTVWHDNENPPVITGLRFGYYDNFNNQLITLPCSPLHISINVDDVEFYDRLCSNINNNYYFIDNHTSQILCSSLITQLLSQISSNHDTDCKKINIHDSRVERVQRFMMDDFASNYSIEELAEKVSMSSRYLRSRFKQKYGITPKQYYLKIRMNHAKFILETSDLSIKKIAVSLGYSDQFVFSRQFKDFYGISPSSIREK